MLDVDPDLGRSPYFQARIKLRTGWDESPVGSWRDRKIFSDEPWRAWPAAD